MIGTLRDLTKNTMIGSLPNIINWNNEQIKKEFDNLYNSEEDCLVKSLIAPEGVVEAHNGRFVNLRTNTLIVDDIDIIGEMQKELEALREEISALKEQLKDQQNL